MVGITLLPFLLVLSMSHTSIDGLACKGGSYTTSGTVDERYDIECTAPFYEELCYVKYTSYHNHMYGFVGYGCLEKGHAYKCNQTDHGRIIDTYECCCTHSNCNIKGGTFFNNCGRNGYQSSGVPYGTHPYTHQNQMP